MITIFENRTAEQKKEWFSLTSIFLLSVIIRLKTNFGTEYIPGGNGAYYLDLVRNLLENGKSIQADFPLVFWLEAAISFVVIKLGLANINTAIDLTSRIFDSVIPALSIIPAYLLTKKILNRKTNWIIPVLMSSVSVLYFSFLILVSEFQKNSLGLLWLFWLIYYLLLVHEKVTYKNLLGVFVFLILTGLTHYGCISVGMAIITVDFICRNLFRYAIKRLFKTIILLTLLLGISFVIMYLINPWRVKSLIRIPEEIFANPILIAIINNKQALSIYDIVSITFLNSVAVVSLVLFVKRFKEINSKHHSFLFSMILLLFFLSSPFLGVEFAQRVYFISYLIAVPLLSFNYNLIRERKKKLLIAIILSAVILGSVSIVVARPVYSNMNKKIFSEMLKMQFLVRDKNRTVIIARHGLEFWTTWILRCDSFRQESVYPAYWNWYINVYVLHQKKDKSPFGPIGIYGKPFLEPELPENSFRIYTSEYFDLYRSPAPPKNFNKYSKGIN